MFRITDAWLREHSVKTPYGNVWTKNQLALLGLKHPLKAGWIANVVGRSLTDDEKREFEKSVHKVTDKTRRKRKERGRRAITDVLDLRIAGSFESAFK